MSFEDHANVNEEAASITIPYAVYLDLDYHRRCIEALRSSGLLDQDNSLGLFTHDPEVAVYLSARYGLLTAREAIADIGQRFGENRKPSIAAVKRFWLRFKTILIREAKT